MITINFGVGHPVIQGMSAEDDFDITIIERPTGTPSGQVVETLRDYARVKTEFTGSINTFNVSATNKNLSMGAVDLSSLYPDVCTIDANGRVFKGAVDGICTIRASAPYGTRHITRDIITVGAATDYVFSNFLPGSLADHVRGLLAGYYAGRAPNDTNLKISINDFTPNQSRIAPDLDMSWQSVNASDGSAFPCSLITPRHALCCEHAGFSVGRQYVFRTTAGAMIYPTVIGVVHLGNDLGLLYFDQPVAGCALAKLTQSLANKTSLAHPQNYGYGFPAIITLQNGYSQPFVTGGRKLMCCAVGGYNPTSIGVGSPLESVFQTFYPMDTASVGGVLSTSIRGGDSGSAVFFPVIEPGNTKPSSVLLTALYRATLGPNYSDHVADINTALNTLAGTPQGTYAVQIADLSAFTSF